MFKKNLFKEKPVRNAAVLIFLLSIIFYGIFVFNFFPGKVVFVKYQAAAGQYLDGTLPQERILDFSPLYLYLNIFIKKYIGNPTLLLIWIQIILVSFSAVLLFLLLKRFFNWTLSLVGAGAFLINKSVLLYTRALEPEPLIIFFILGFVYFATRAATSSGDAPVNPDITFLLAGLFLGLSIFTRSNFFPIALVTPVFFLIKYKDKKKWLRYTSLFWIPILIVTGFLAIRNSSIARSFTMFQMNPGQIFFEGNNPNSWGESAIYPPLVDDFANQFPDQPDFEHVVYKFFARQIKAGQINGQQKKQINNQALSLNEINWYWAQKGLNFILDHPFHFFKRLLVKINFVFHNYRRHDLGNVFRNDQNLLRKVPTIPFALISSLAMLGMLLGARKWKDRFFIYAVLLWQIGVMVLLYVSDRQRVVIISMMIFFALDFVNRMISKRKHIYVGLLVLIIFPMLYFENQLMKEEKYLWQRHFISGRLLRQAFQQRKNGNPEVAAGKNALAAAYAPWLIEKGRLSGLNYKEKSLKEISLRLAISFKQKNPSALFDLGVLFIENRKLPEAEYLFKLLEQGKYDFNRQYTQCSLPEFYLARIYSLKNDKTTAVSYLDKALTRNPGDPWVLSYLFSLTNDPVYKNKISRYFDEIDAQFFLGKALLETGNSSEAVQCFTYVADKLPRYRRGLIYLSIAQGSASEYQEAVETYMKAIALAEDPVFAEKEIIEIFTKYREQHPQAPNSKKLLQKVLSQFGHSSTDQLTNTQ